MPCLGSRQIRNPGPSGLCVVAALLVGCLLGTASSNFLISLPLQMLFKKNLFEMAINLAKSQHLDSDGLAQIFMQYGDHLYSKGNHDGAVQQYIRLVLGALGYSSECSQVD